MNPPTRLLCLLVIAIGCSCFSPLAFGDIFQSAGSGDQVAVAQYLRHGGSPNERDTDGSTPLHFAVANNRPAIVKMLLDAKADVNATMLDGRTPLHVAIQHGCTGLVETLLQAGADVTIEDEKDQTPRDVAAAARQTATVALLDRVLAARPAVAPESDPSTGVGLPSEWNQWRGPMRNGVSPASPALASSWPASGPKVLWRAGGLGPTNDCGYGSPVVAGGRVYLYLHCKSEAGDGSPYIDRLLSLDAATGAVLWRKDYGTKKDYYPTSGTPVVWNRRVFFTGKEHLYCLDANTGAAVWTQHIPMRGIYSSAAVIRGVLVVVAGQIRGFDPGTGKQLWARNAPAGTYGPTMETTSPAIWLHSGRAYAIIHAGSLFCIAPRSGRVVWQRAGVGENDGASPVVVGDTLVLGMAGKQTRAFRLSITGATPLWSTHSDEVQGSPLLYAGQVITLGGWGCSHGGGKCYIRSIDAQTGETKWEEQLPGYQDCSSPIGADGKVFLFMDGGHTIAMIGTTGQRLAVLGKLQLHVEHAAGWSSFALAEGRLYVRTGCGELTCYDVTAAGNKH